MINHPAFTVEPWSLRETHLDLDVLAQTESLFALSNGHIGLRANLDEGEPFGIPARAAADALRWRHATLDLARGSAQQFGGRGAAFPWRTMRGQESSGYWPAGTAAFHINADIADAVSRYQASADDTRFEREIGLELLVETARLWGSLGHRDTDGRFRIDGVTGPDEYSAIAGNNLYTNLIARRNLRAAAAAVERHPRLAATFQADLARSRGMA